MKKNTRLILLNAGMQRNRPWVAAFFLSLVFSTVGESQATSFTYEGRLYSASGVPLLESVDVKFQILNPAGNCVLYEEVQSGVDLSSSKGAFSLSVGSGVGDSKRSANFRGAFNPSMISVFRNGATLSGIPTADCAAGSYVAGASDNRLLRVQVTKGSTTETLSPDLVINTVPSAQVANSLQGFLPSDFLRLDVTNGISGNIGLTATGTGAGQTREFRFYELAANGVEYSALKAPDAMATSLTYVLPSSAPAAGDVLKATVPSSGVVTLSWGADAGAGGGISNFNGSNQSSQSFTAVDIAAVVTAPAWSTNIGTGAHTLQIPMAVGAGVTGGLITKAEHTAFSNKVDRAGDTMSGNLAMGTNKITGVGDPTNAQEAATKAYVDSQDSGKLSGTLTATRIPYASGASTLTDSANFTYIPATGAMTLGGTNPSITSNDSLTLAAGGTNRNVVLTPSGTGFTLLSGNVGIGTASPSEKLHIAAGVSDGIALFTRNQNSLYPGITIRDLSAGTRAIIGFNTYGSNEWAMGVDGTNGFSISAGRQLNASNLFHILPSGNVGIGTTSPGGGVGANLHLYRSSSDARLLIEAASNAADVRVKGASCQTNGYFINGGSNSASMTFMDGCSGDAMAFRYNSTELLTLKNTGNVGIGTTAPGALLQLGTAGTSLGTMRLAGNTSGYVQIQPAAAAGSWTMTLPATDGANGEVLQTDGNGVTSWVAAGGGLSGLTTGRVPFATSATAIGDDSSLFWDNTNKRLGIGTSSPLYALHVRTAGAAPTLEFSNGTSDVAWVGSRVQATKTSDMGDGFGVVQVFSIQDDAGVSNRIGSIGAVRSGADNSGNLILSTFVSGTANQRMTIAAAGNVGIGTTTPSQKLDIDGNIYASGGVYLATSGTSAAPTYTFASSTGTGMFRGGADILGFATTGAARMTIDASGYVGIGTTNPFAQFVVGATSSGGFEVIPGAAVTIQAYNRGTPAYSNFNLDGASIRFRPGGTEAMRVENTGKVGIGTTSPVSMLDISGLDSDGTLRVYDQTATTGVTRSIVRAGAGQSTTNLMEWQNSAGTILSRIDSTGRFVGDGSQLTNLAATSVPANVRTRSLGYVFDGGGSALTSGRRAYYAVPFSCTIAAWTMTLDTGTATVDVWKRAAGTAIPTVADTITASAIPAISTGTNLRSTTLTGWTTGVTANDILGFYLSAVSSATLVSLTMECVQ